MVNSDPKSVKFDRKNKVRSHWIGMNILAELICVGTQSITTTTLQGPGAPWFSSTFQALDS